MTVAAMRRGLGLGNYMATVKSKLGDKPRIFISGALEPRRWARSAARFLSWREELIGFALPEYPPHEIYAFPPSPCDPTWPQGLDPSHAVECERLVFVGPFATPYGLTEDERETWRQANTRRIESADLVFVRLANPDDDDARRITTELRRAAQLRIPCFVHEEATGENAILRSALRSARKRTDGASMSVADSLAEAIFCWRDGLRKRRSRGRAATLI